MALPVPNLDDRTFQDLVNEARSRIPVHCPEWSDHNLSDPGITLIELFAWMTELIIYRLNQVPDKNYIKFLDLIGVTLAPTNPASTEITFRLAAPQAAAITIPTGTEVATVRTETQDAIVFTTSEDLEIAPPRLEYFLISYDGSEFDDYISVVGGDGTSSAGAAPANGREGSSINLFQPVPEPGNAFYLGYSSDPRGTVLALTLDCEPQADQNQEQTTGGMVLGLNPSNPPLLWEYWDGDLLDWVTLEYRPDSLAWLETDNTTGLIQRGQVVLHIPQTAGGLLLILISYDGSEFDDYISVVGGDGTSSAGAAPANGREGSSINLFQPVPEPGNAFYLGYSSDPRGTVLALTLDCEPQADQNQEQTTGGMVLGLNPSNPPLLWEYWDGDLLDWVTLEYRPDSLAWLETDNTTGLIQRGQVVLHIPQTAGETTVGLRNAYWIRCQVIPWNPEQGSYRSSPQLRSVSSQAIGGTVIASNVTRVVAEMLGISDGKPGQVMTLPESPMLPLGSGETVEVEREDDTGWEEWQQVSEFSQVGPEDKVFMSDPVAGEILFGPAIRSPNGEDTRYGATPPRGSHVRLSSYRRRSRGQVSSSTRFTQEASQGSSSWGIVPGSK